MATASQLRVRVELAAASLLVLFFHLPLRGLLLSLLLLLLRLFALLVWFATSVNTFLVLRYHYLLVGILFAGADVRIQPVPVLQRLAVWAFGLWVAMLVP